MSEENKKAPEKTEAASKKDQNSHQKYIRWLPVIIIMAIIIVLFFIWDISFPAYLWAAAPNYLSMYVDFVIHNPAGSFLTVNTGFRGTVAWVCIPLYAVLITYIVLYFLGKQKNQQYIVLNKYYLIFLVVFALFAISYQNAAQHYEWYWNPLTDSLGYADTWTHIASTGLLGAMVAPLALERFVGWNRKYWWFFVWGIDTIAAIFWEISETLDAYYLRPAPGMFNYPMKSLHDIFNGGGIGTLVALFVYFVLVVSVGELRK